MGVKTVDVKFTGIIRELDDLGRFTLPKNLRKTLGIQPNTPMEVHIIEDMICLKPHDHQLEVDITLNLLDGAINDKFHGEVPSNIVQEIRKLKLMCRA